MARLLGIGAIAFVVGACGSDGTELPACNAGESVVWDGAQWTCQPQDELPSCNAGETIVWDGTQWICQAQDDSEPPTVVATLPADGAGDAEPAEQVVAVFSELIDPATLAGAMTLVDDALGVDVGGAVTGLGTTATFAPTQRLGLARGYTATVAASVSDLAGNLLSAAYTWSFVTRDGTWDTLPELIEIDDAGFAQLPQVAMDTAGNAVAVWQQSDGTRFNIRSNRYVAGAGWGAAELIETNNAGNAELPQVAVDPAANAVAVWQQSDGTRFNIWSNRYVAGAGWGTAELIETNNAGDALGPRVAVDAAGNAVAVWEQSDGTHDDIWSNRYVAGAGWGTPQLLETDNVHNAFASNLAVDAAGNAVAVWQQYDGAHFNILSNRYVAGTGWGAAELIETDDAGNAWTPQVAVDAAGNAVAVWHQSDGARNNIWSNRYVAGTGWGTAQLIETDDAGDARNPRVAVDAAGNAVAVWHQYDGTRDNIWSNRYVAGTGWGTAQLIETDDAGNAYYPEAAVDAAGNAIALWEQSDGARFDIWSNRYVAGAGWGTAQLIETGNAGDAQDPQLAVDAAGNAVAVWYQSDGARANVWSNRFE